MKIRLLKITFRRTKINPAKISNPYALFAVMLLVMEVLFVVWFSKAEGSTERSIAGIVMAIIFLFLMLLVLKINRIEKKQHIKNNCPNFGLTMIFQTLTLRKLFTLALTKSMLYL